MYRSLLPIYVGSLAAIAMTMFRFGMDWLCAGPLSIASNCVVAMPQVHGGWVVAVFLLGTAISAYQAYVDFVRGRYYEDLADAGYV